MGPDPKGQMFGSPDTSTVPLRTEFGPLVWPVRLCHLCLSGTNFCRENLFLPRSIHSKSQSVASFLEHYPLFSFVGMMSCPQGRCKGCPLPDSSTYSLSMQVRSTLQCQTLCAHRSCSLCSCTPSTPVHGWASLCPLPKRSSG